MTNPMKDHKSMWKQRTWTASAEQPPMWLCALILATLSLGKIFTHFSILSLSTGSGQATVPWLLARGGEFSITVIESRPPGLAALLVVLQRLIPIEPILLLQILNVAVVIAILWLVFTAGAQILHRMAGLLAAIVWFLLEPVYGNILFYFDTVLGLIFLAAVLLWWRLGPRYPRLTALLLGLLLGSATLIKQHAWVTVAIVGLWMLLVARRQRFHIVLYAVGALLVPGAVLLYFLARGSLDSYLLWNWGMIFSSVRPGSPLDGDLIRKYLLTIAFVPIFAALAQYHLDRRKAGLTLALWLGATATMLPNFGEIYVMAQLPLICVMSGASIALIIRELAQQTPSISRAVMIGACTTFSGAWLVMIAAAYVAGPLGRGQVLAYDEFQPVSERLRTLAQPDDTLYVLPEYDGSAQLHMQADMMPPGVWISGHRWYLAVTEVRNALLQEWETNPPTFIVYFPDLIAQSMPEIEPLVDFMQDRYLPVERIEDIHFNGEAIIYRLAGDPPGG